MKSILLKYENEKEYYDLANLKARYESILKESFTWEQFIYRLKLNFDCKLIK
jgi:hypothetical protein